jgi:hypothetical protein
MKDNEVRCTLREALRRQSEAMGTPYGYIVISESGKPLAIASALEDTCEWLGWVPPERRLMWGAIAEWTAEVGDDALSAAIEALVLRMVDVVPEGYRAYRFHLMTGIWAKSVLDDDAVYCGKGVSDGEAS